MNIRKEYGLKMPPRVFCGQDTTGRLAEDIAAGGYQRVALLADSAVLTTGALDETLDALRQAVPQLLVYDGVPPEPAVADVLRAHAAVADTGAELVVAVGGGSVMDTGKFVSVMLKNPGFAADITDPARIAEPGAPLYMVPTSAGTGSEATPNAIVLIPEKKVKQGVVHDNFIPHRVYLNPLLTRTMPPAVTAATGLDAFCHCVETLISRKHNPFSELFSVAGMSLIWRALPRAYRDGEDRQAREDMLIASFYGGVAIAASSTVAVHALSYPLGGSYHIPHGVSNAILLPHVMRFNLPVLGAQLGVIAQAMGIEARGRAEKELEQEISDALFDLCRLLAIPTDLKRYNITGDDLDFLTKSAFGVRRLLDQNPRDMSPEDIRAIYAALL